jgi:hypothetical protein
MVESSAKPAQVLYREAQLMAPWAFLLLIGLTVFVWYLAATLPPPGNSALAAGAAFVTLLSVAIIAAFFRMTVELTPAELRVRFGWLSMFGDALPLSRVEGCQAVTYRPVAYGGWGLRGSLRGGGALSARGNRGVRLRLDDGKEVIVGSQRPEALAEAIDRALRHELTT